MKREARDFRETAPKPVKRIPLEIKRPGLRLLLVITALAVAAGAFFFGIRGLVQVEPGWAVLEADGASGITAADDFTLRVELGAGTETPLAERKRLVTVYSAAARKAYTLYTAQDSADGEHNILYINQHPGEEIEVDGLLYRALEKTLAAGDWLYLGPVYEVWDSVYFSREDREAAAADPRKDEASAAFVAQAAEWIRSGGIRLELLGENKVRLTISDAYRAFGEENGITRWLDFGWQKNAYIADDLAEALLTAGWERAVLQSRDGFIRCLDERGSFSLNLYADAGGVQQIAQAAYRGPASAMMLLPAPGGVRNHAYRYRDGTLRTAWISAETGLDVRPADGLTALSAEEGCAELLNRFLDLLTREDGTEAEWKAAAGNDCALWLAKEGVLASLGNGLLTVTAGGSAAD